MVSVRCLPFIVFGALCLVACSGDREGDRGVDPTPSDGTNAPGHERSGAAFCVACNVVAEPENFEDPDCVPVCYSIPKCECPGDSCSYAGDVDGDGVWVEVSLAEFWEYPYATAVVCTRPHPEDCDDADPLRFESGVVDMDGDGHGTEAVCGYPGEPHVVFGPLYTDCDDADPERHAWGYLDRDGDGFTSEKICAGPLDPVKSRDVGDDCDDTDPNLHQLYYPDEDGDQSGASGRGACQPYREGLATFGGDCDDADARRPSALEVWGDGYDADCDGEDGTAAFDAYCDLDHNYLPEGCEGVNLILLDHCGPENCSTSRLLRVANNGTERYVGMLAVTTDQSVLWEEEVDLEPDEAALVTTHGVGYQEYVRLYTPGVENCNDRFRELEPVSCHIP